MRGGVGAAYLLPLLHPNFFALTRFRTPGVRWCNLVLGRSKPRRRSFQSLSLYSVRVRRKPGGRFHTALSTAEHRVQLRASEKTRVRYSSNVYRT
jgi:hypothetical protein